MMSPSPSPSPFTATSGAGSGSTALSRSWRPARPRVRRGLTAIAIVVGVLATVAPVAVATAPPSAAAVRAFGADPFTTILAAADANKKCGLGRDELAAIVISPVFPEAGGTATVPPSPMTLSRWDTGSSLWPYGNKTTPYQKAFWHPGVGLWQFDSAGGWNMSTAQAIDVATAAPLAAKTMADRYCASASGTAQGKRSYAWGPWYGCVGSCEATFNDIFDGATKTLRMDRFPLSSAVTNTGGMVTRSCVLNGTPVTCSYINPSAAQGTTSWAQPGFGPTPITAAFYNISHNGREWRVWLPQDTGYGPTISADKPITGNARTSLVWSTSTQLCDTTAARGACGRVADTPWGPVTATPFGSLDIVTGGIEAVSVGGWAIDPDTNDSIPVHVYVDGVYRAGITADGVRGDVAAAVPGYGDRHGFSATINGVSAGSRLVCVFAINVGPYGSTNPQLGCQTVTVAPAPPGPFSDVNGIHTFITEIQWLVSAGITAGYPDLTFRPGTSVSRGEMALFLWRSAGEPEPVAGSPTFDDVSGSSLASVAISWLAGRGITTGFGDGTFRPLAPITREGMAAFLYRLEGSPRGIAPPCSAAPFTDVPVSNTFCGEIDWLVDEQIATGYDDGSFRPVDTVSRQATAAFLYRLIGT